jgi:hypothetical protein
MGDFIRKRWGKLVKHGGRMGREKPPKSPSKPYSI